MATQATVRFSRRLFDNRLLFAGEATSSNFFSTAHGAHNSGGRAAREVIASYGR
jgi:monoamine oxidase